jgi:hypothetical protein
VVKVEVAEDQIPSRFFNRDLQSRFSSVSSRSPIISSWDVGGGGREDRGRRGCFFSSFAGEFGKISSAVFKIPPKLFGSEKYSKSYKFV